MNAYEKKISIGVPIFNEGKFIKKKLDFFIILNLETVISQIIDFIRLLLKKLNKINW